MPSLLSIPALALAGAAGAAVVAAVAADDHHIDLGCPWTIPRGNSRWSTGCTAFPTNVTGDTGDMLEIAVMYGYKVVMLPDQAAFDACDFSQEVVLTDGLEGYKGQEILTLTINTPGTYYLASNYTHCAEPGMQYDGVTPAGPLKVAVEVTGDSKGPNSFTVTMFEAHDACKTDGPEEDHGKCVYWERTHDLDLHAPCPESAGWCKDFSESRGSCYYSLEDFHIGHAVFCDVSEIECCGYPDCSSRDLGNRGKFQNGTTSGHYWYPPGYVSGMGGCCHCHSSCDHSLETKEDPSMCTYYDVTSTSCQRNPDFESAGYDTIGFLKCSVPGDDNVNGPYPPLIREIKAGKGDMNEDGRVNVIDVVTLIQQIITAD